MDDLRRVPWLRRSFATAVCIALSALAGCKSPYVEADVVNATGHPVTLVEVDYPSASFGVESLPAAATYHYRFKILGSGPTSVDWTDATHKEHKTSGPNLTEGQRGTLTVTLHPTQATFTASLH